MHSCRILFDIVTVPISVCQVKTLIVLVEKGFILPLLMLKHIPYKCFLYIFSQVQAISQPELNIFNSSELLQHTEQSRRTKLFRTLAKQYL